MFLIAISLLVAFHEYGHFIVARLCGVKVKRFSIGFGKVLWSRVDKKGTEFAFSLLPFGGYVKMFDDVKEREAYDAKPIWQRMSIVLAGPFFNFIFALFGFWLVFMIGISNITPTIGEVSAHSIAAEAGLKQGQQIIELNHQAIFSWQDVAMELIKAVGDKVQMPIIVQNSDHSKWQTHLDLRQWHYDASDILLLESIGFKPYAPPIPPIIGKVEANSPGEKAHLQSGDKIIAIDEQPMQDWQTITDYVQQRANTVMTLHILRHDQLQKVSLKTGEHWLDAKHAIGFIGVQSQAVAWPDSMKSVERYPPFSALKQSFIKTYQLSVTTIELVGKMITGSLSMKGMSGPVGIAQGAGDSASLGFVSFLSFLSLISISLGVLNLLPIPILDGGQFMFLIIEAVIGHKISDKVQEVSLKIGIFILLSVMLLALYNDLSRIVYS